MKKTLAVLTTGLMVLSAGAVFAHDIDTPHIHTKAGKVKMMPKTNMSNKKMVHKMMAKDIVQTAMDAGMFKTLAKALMAAGLVDTLKGKGPFTVFAPTDAAFAKVPKADLDKLMMDKAALKKVLLYHVVLGKVMAADVMKMSTGKTVEGEDVKITVKGKSVMVNNAMVTKADIKASNGLIHVIDSVLMPPKK